MKHTFFALVLISLALTACKKESEEDTVVITPQTENASDYTQLEVGNYWVYERRSINFETGEEIITGNLDSIYIASDTIIDGLEYKRFGGSWFGLNFGRVVRNDGANLLSFDGKTFMTTTLVNDTININTNISNNAIDSIYTLLKSDEVLIETPAGVYESNHQYERVFFMNQEIFPPELTQRIDTEYYSKDVGVVKYTSYIATAPVNLEMRLIRYSVD